MIVMPVGRLWQAWAGSVSLGYIDRRLASWQVTAARVAFCQKLHATVNGQGIELVGPVGNADLSSVLFLFLSSSSSFSRCSLLQ